jgi:hypothetical protein
MGPTLVPRDGRTADAPGDRAEGQRSWPRTFPWRQEHQPGWPLNGVRLFVAVLVLFQLIQGLIDSPRIANSPFTRSYYLITYNHGFVRRGLIGEGLRLIVGVPTVSEVDGVADLVAILAIGSVLMLIELLIRRGSPESCSMAILLAASPFIFDYIVVDRRPDLLAIPALVALGFILMVKTRGLIVWLGGMGLVFGALALVHEDVLMIELPWAIVLVTVATLGQGGDAAGRGGSSPVKILGERLAALVVPSVIAAVALLTFGLPNAEKVAKLRADVSGFPLHSGTMFEYLPDTLRKSIDRVGSIPQSVALHTIALCLLLLIPQLAWVVFWGRSGLTAIFTRQGHRAIGLALGAVVVIPMFALFATGVDWLRWLCGCGTSWLVVQSFSILLLAPARRNVEGQDNRIVAGDGRPAVVAESPDRVGLSLWMPALAVYLAAIPPIDVSLTAGLLRHFFVFF